MCLPEHGNGHNGKNVCTALYGGYIERCAVHRGHGCPCAALVPPQRPHPSCVVSVGWRPGRGVAAPLFAYATCYPKTTAQHGWCQRHISMALGPFRVPVTLQCTHYTCLHPGCAYPLPGRALERVCVGRNGTPAGGDAQGFRCSWLCR